MSRKKPVALKYDHLTEHDIKKFWSNVNKGDTKDCWEWQGGKAVVGYGLISLERFGGRIRFYSHRVSVLISTMSLNPDLVVRHKCNNRMCVNPAHLIEGTVQENANDTQLANRSKKGKTSKYRGVYLDGRTKKWVAKLTITVRNKKGKYQKQITAGVFDKEKDAARAYDIKVQEVYPDIGKDLVNFPELIDSDYKPIRWIDKYKEIRENVVEQIRNGAYDCKDIVKKAGCSEVVLRRLLNRDPDLKNNYYANRVKYKKFYGVSKRGKGGKYRARLTFKGVVMSLGEFESSYLAAQAVENKRIELGLPAINFYRDY
jgi:hypothetical protein